MSSDVCHYLNMKKKELCLRGRLFSNTLKRKEERALQGESTAQKRLSDGEVEMDRKSCERINSFLALNETNQQLESQRLELYQAIQWAGSSSKEQTEDYLEKCVRRTNRIYQEHHARS